MKRWKRQLNQIKAQIKCALYRLEQEEKNNSANHNHLDDNDFNSSDIFNTSGAKVDKC